MPKYFSAIILWLDRGLTNAHVVDADVDDRFGNSFGTGGSVSLQGNLGLECGLTAVAREGVWRCNVSRKTAAASKTFPT